MKRLLLLLSFVVFWRQWEAGYPSNGNQPILVEEAQSFELLDDAKSFVDRHREDERYTEMHIYRIGEEVQ